MASLQDIRRRIRSVKNTQQITKAMKMISAVKLRKSQESLISMRPYANTLHKLLAQVVARIEPDGQTGKAPGGPLAQAFFAPREEKNIHLVVIASDKGLCGGFNSNLFKALDTFLKNHECAQDDNGEPCFTGVPRGGGGGLGISPSTRKAGPNVFAKLAQAAAENKSVKQANKAIFLIPFS